MEFPGAENKTSKSFWQRPEGTTGMITLLGIAVGAWLLLPTLTAAAWAVAGFIGGLVGIAVNVALLIVLGAVITGMLFVLTDKRFRTLISYFYKSAMRKVTGIFVEIDPIGIMKSYIDSMKDKKTMFDEKKSQLKGQITAFEQTIANNEREATKALKLVQAAKNANDPKEAIFYSREHGRYDEANKRFKGTLTKMTMIYGFMVKYQEACDYVIRDLVSEVKIREQERKMALSSHSAMSAAKAILKGSGAEKDLFDQAMEFAVEDFAAKIGEIDSFIEDTQSIIAGINLQNGMWEQDAEKKLAEFEKRSDSLVLGGTKRLMIENTNTGNAVPLNWSAAQPSYVSRNDDGIDMKKFL